MILTLSQVEALDLSHITDAAAHWQNVAQKWEDSFDAVHRESQYPGGTSWQGRAAEACYQHTGRDRFVALDAGDSLRDAARVARNGADDLHWAKSEVLNAVEDARADGHQVTDNFMVVPPHPVRAPQAAAHAANIGDMVAVLNATDSEVASNLTSAAAGVQAVNHHFKQDADPFGDVGAGLSRP